MRDISLKRRTVLEMGIVVVLMALSASIAGAATGADPSSSSAYTYAQQNDPPMPPVPYAVGDVFVGVGTGIIKQFYPNGTLKDILNTTTGCAEDLGMAFDSAGNLYATAAFGSCFGNGTVTKFNNMGNRIGPFGSGYSVSTESVVINASDVFVGQPDGTKQLLEFDLSGASINSFSPAPENRGTDWNDLAADQCTMYYTSEGTHVKRFNVCNNTQMSDFNAVPLAGPTAYALRILPTGEVIVADSDRVVLLNASGGLEKTYAAPTDPGFDFLFALNIDPDGTHFWTASYGGGKVYKYDFTNTTGPIFEFDPVKLGYAVSGLAIFGEKTVALPKLGSISGMKFNDLNGNGVKDMGEPGLANWTITLTNQTGGMISTLTDAGGNYSFTNLSDGNYTVGEVLKLGWMQTAPATGTYNITITGGAAITGKDFGNKRLPPTAACVKGPNPAGNIPPAKGGQRPDGFYKLLGFDILDPSPVVFVNDTGSGTIFGPFANGTNIKYTQAPGATPSIKTIGGPTSDVAWHITGIGDAGVFSMNNAGVNSTQVLCLVPPPPK